MYSYWSVTLCIANCSAQYVTLQTTLDSTEKVLVRFSIPEKERAAALLLSPDEKVIAVKVKVSDKRVTIVISDHGIGIPADKAERIFDEFYRVDDSLTTKVSGTGLGLSITRQIIENHRGTITHSSM